MSNATTRNMASSEVDPQADILSLLRQISDDNKHLHTEIASLRAETTKISTSLHRRLDKVVSNLDGAISTNCTQLSTQIDNVESHLIQTVLVVDPDLDLLQVRQDITDIRMLITDRFSATVSSIGEGLCEETKNIRSDIASMRSVLNTALSLQPGKIYQVEFLPFPKLPPELRLKIWKIASFNNPSVLKLHANASSGNIFKGFHYSGYHTPPLLRTSRESRMEALKWYKRKDVSLPNDLFCRGQFLREMKPKYQNLAIDVLYLDINTTWKSSLNHNSWVKILMGEKLLPEYRRVAVPASFFLDCDRQSVVRELAEPQCQIEEIIVVENGEDLSNTMQRLEPAGKLNRLHFAHGQSTDFQLLAATVNLISTSVEHTILQRKTSAAAGSSSADDQAMENASVVQVPTNSASAGAASSVTCNEVARNSGRVRHRVKFTFMELADVHSIPKSQLLLG